MFPFLPFVSLSQCIKCGNSNQQKLKTNRKWQPNIFAIHNENHTGTSKEYYIVLSNFSSSKCKIEYLHEVASDSKLLEKNNKFDQKTFKNKYSKVSKKNSNNIKIEEIYDSNINKEINLKNDEIFDENFSPFVSKGRIRESFERSQIDEYVTENLPSDNNFSNLLLINEQNNIIANDINSTTFKDLIKNNDFELKLKKKKELNSKSEVVTVPFENTQDIKIINKNFEFNPLLNLSSLEFNDINKQNCINLSTKLINKNKDLPLTENNTELQNAILSPLSNNQNSPKLLNPSLTIITPPPIQVTRAKQNAFQPSQAMLELFGNVKQDSVKENDRKIFNNKEKFCSEPGPELIELDFSDSKEIVLTSKNLSPNFKKNLKLKPLYAKNFNGINELKNENNNIFNGEKVNFKLTKTQLNNPGPELASENDEIDNENLEIENKIDEAILLNKEENININQEKNINNALNCHLTEKEKLNSTIATTINNAENNNLCNINETTKVTKIIVNEEKSGEDKKYTEQIKLDTNKNTKKVKQNNYKQKEKIIENNEKNDYDVFGRKNMFLINTFKNNKKNNNIITINQQKSENKRNNSAKINEHYNIFSMPAFTNNSLKTTTLKNNINVFNLATTKKEIGIEAESNIFYKSNVEINEKNNITISLSVKPTFNHYACNTNSQKKNEIDNSFVKKSETLIKENIIKNTECFKNKNNNNNLTTISNQEQDINNVKKTNQTFKSNTNTLQITRDHNLKESDDNKKMIHTNEKNNSALISEEGGDSNLSILIKNVNIINDDEIFTGDIYIQNGIIKKISKLITTSTEEETEIIDASGRWLLPGGIDIETHFSSSYSSTNNSFLNGTKAALAGGTTSIIDVVVPKLNESLTAAVDRVRNFADLHSKCYYGLSVLIKGEWNDQIKVQMTELVREKGINNFFIHLNSESNIFEAFEHSKQLGIYCRVVPENRELSFLLEKRQRVNNSTINKLEADSINRYCLISDLTNTPFSVLLLHSSENINDAFNNGKKNGAFVNAEISLSSLLNQNNSNEIKSSREYALDLLAENSLCLCSSGEQASKNQLKNFAIQHRLALLWEQGVYKSARFDPMRFVAVTSTNAAKIFNMYPQKGRIAVGSDADVVLWDFETPQNINDEILHAKPLITICGGKIVYQNEKYCSRKIKIVENVKNSTKENSLFLNLTPNSKYLFTAIQLKEKSFNLSHLTIGNRLNIENQTDSELNTNNSRSIIINNSITSTILSTNNEYQQSPNTLQNNANEINSNHPFIAGSRNRNIQSTNPPNRSTKKVTQPPGGKSTAFW